ncbi:hypothetical protein ASF53_16865 [Methylobacterium sp. Leaf123]|uniref:hypothetical protein n=1 Tax=Methylobacterium sp. Leaf123 TaxID=1736264 RepID=UPI0006FCFCE2|nr:hypothetical protein [Methylobacterium sp. Leaf123]KQQ11833.1 hypothetical protein ASF53_16865 [Methylobacterium sp. Leaf123]
MIGDQHTTWGNLAGRPARWSHPVRHSGVNRREYEGFIKLRLAHSEGRSYLIPDVLIAVGGLRYFLPSFFSPPSLAFDAEPGTHVAQISIDVGGARATRLERLLVRVRSDERVHVYEDGAQLYRCRFEGPRGIAGLAKGECRRDPSGDFLLRVYHHTTPANASSIRAAGELWSSAWNLAGTRRLTNVSYGYFTTLPRIRDEEDLRLVAMASGEFIHLQTTSDRPREEVVALKVYRGDTRDRTAALAFDVPCGLIAPTHLYLHPFVGMQAAYFEVVSPEIIRVGVVPAAKLRVIQAGIHVADADRRHFGYVIIGDTQTPSGLAAPYEEEETRQVTHLEPLDAATDFFAFWLAHANTDQVSGRAIDPRELAPA